VRASVAFVTKSYSPDLERCELLSRSVELLAPETRHWIIVDSRDQAAFRTLEGPRTTIVTTEELLGRRLQRFVVPFRGGRNLWIGPRTPPVRGWLVQQLAKLALTRVADKEVLVHADSDIVLTRRFRPAALTDASGSLLLYSIPSGVDERLPDQVAWHRTSEELLGLAPRPLPLPDYVGGLIPWRRDIADELLTHVESRSGRDWMRTLIRAKHVSEYTLYGRFVEDALGSSDRQRASAVSLCRCYWGPDPLPAHELDTFVEEAGDSELAVMVSAKTGMRPADYGEVFERRWQKALAEE
jgi:Family of unknown function (DUF6492)